MWRPIAIALVLVGAFPLIDPGRGQAADTPDPVERKSPTRTELIGSASARVAAAGPIVGGLNLEAGFARSAVDRSGEATRGESATMTAGAAGLFLTLSGAPSAIPEPTRADSNGTADAERSVVAPAGDFVRVGHEKAHAEPRSSEALTRLGDLTVGQAAEVLGGSSVASIDDRGARSSAAIGELRLGGEEGPAVVLSGLAWRAEQPHTAPAQAGFSIGSARIGETPLSVGTPEQTAGAIDAINTVLASQGIHLFAPVATAGADGGRVDALRIELRDPPLNRAVAGAAYSPLAPAVNDAQAAVVEAGGSDPRVSQALLGANLALSVLLGNGGVGVELGGAMAGLTTREVPDLGSLFGGSEPPLAGGEPGERIDLPEARSTTARRDPTDRAVSATALCSTARTRRAGTDRSRPVEQVRTGFPLRPVRPLRPRLRKSRSGPVEAGDRRPPRPVTCPRPWPPPRWPPASPSPVSTGWPVGGRSVWLPGCGPPPGSGRR